MVRQAIHNVPKRTLTPRLRRLLSSMMDLKGLEKRSVAVTAPSAGHTHFKNMSPAEDIAAASFDRAAEPQVGSPGDSEGVVC